MGLLGQQIEEFLGVLTFMKLLGTRLPGAGRSSIGGALCAEICARGAGIELGRKLVREGTSWQLRQDAGEGFQLKGEGACQTKSGLRTIRLSRRKRKLLSGGQESRN